MDQRREPRVRPEGIVSIFVLGEGHPGLQGRVVDVSSKGMGVTISAYLPPGSPIKIEYQDELLLGEVAHCSPVNGEYRVGVAVKHRLSGLASLHRLNRALHDASAPVPAPAGDETLSQTPPRR